MELRAFGYNADKTGNPEQKIIIPYPDSTYKFRRSIKNITTLSTVQILRPKIWNSSVTFKRRFPRWEPFPFYSFFISNVRHFSFCANARLRYIRPLKVSFFSPRRVLRNTSKRWSLLKTRRHVRLLIPENSRPTMKKKQINTQMAGKSTGLSSSWRGENETKIKRLPPRTVSIL